MGSNLAKGLKTSLMALNIKVPSKIMPFKEKEPLNGLTVSNMLENLMKIKCTAMAFLLGQMVVSTKANTKTT